MLIFLSVKNCRDIIKRYKAALDVYREGSSMKAAFESIGVDRNTIARTAAIAELSLAKYSLFNSCHWGSIGKSPNIGVSLRSQLILTPNKKVQNQCNSSLTK